MNGAMREAYGKACEAARVFEGFAKEHPVAVGVFVTVVAIGVVVLLAPEVLEWLGFVEWGIVEGEWGFFRILFFFFFWVFLRVYADVGVLYRELGCEMAGYVYGVGTEGVVVLVLSEIGNDDMEMGLRVGGKGERVWRSRWRKRACGKGSFDLELNDSSLTG